MNEYYVIRDMVTGMFIDSTGKECISKYAKEFFGYHEALECINSELPAGHYTIITCYRKLE